MSLIRRQICFSDIHAVHGMWLQSLVTTGSCFTDHFRKFMLGPTLFQWSTHVPVCTFYVAIYRVTIDWDIIFILYVRFVYIIWIMNPLILKNNGFLTPLLAIASRQQSTLLTGNCSSFSTSCNLNSCWVRVLFSDTTLDIKRVVIINLLVMTTESTWIIMSIAWLLMSWLIAT